LRSWIAAAVILSVVAGTAMRQGFKLPDDDPVGGGGTGGFGSGDSTTYSLPNRTGPEIVAGTGVFDTTAFFSIAGNVFPDCAFAGQQLLKLVIESDAVAGDTLTLTTQYSNDQVAIFSLAAVLVIGASPQQVLLMTCDTNANMPIFGFRFVRLILGDEDVSRTAVYTGVKQTPLAMKNTIQR